jgi:hypothetical protein
MAKRHRLFEVIVFAELGLALFQEITNSRLEAFRAALLRGRDGTGNTIKAVRNIIEWHLRSFWPTPNAKAARASDRGRAREAPEGQ